MASLTVIVCTYRRVDVLPALLGDVVGQLPADGVVWVVDQSPGPEAEAVARIVGGLNDSRVRLHHQHPGLPQARNAGLARCDSEVVWFLDDDCRLHPGALDAHLKAYRDPRVGGVVGWIDEAHVRPNASKTTNRIDRGGRVRTRLTGHQRMPIETLKGCNMSFRVQALRSAGGFDPSYGGTAFLEDADASASVARLGWQLWFEPAARVRHLSRPTGGVRQDSAARTEWWRFHNTGYFVRRHRGRRALPLTAVVFTAIACRRALEWRSPRAVPRLLSALAQGAFGESHAVG